jgi:hypothetical protein
VDTYGRDDQGGGSNEQGARSPEEALTELGKRGDEQSMQPESLREEWLFVYDVMMDPARMGRYVKGLHKTKIVCLPHFRLAWPYYYPPLETALPSLERTNDASDMVWGVLLDYTGKDLNPLERYLRVPNRYRHAAVSTQDRGGRRFPAFTYVLNLRSDEAVKPSKTYLTQLVAAAKERDLPDEWISQLQGLTPS